MGGDAPALQQAAVADPPQGELAGGGAGDEPVAVVGEAGAGMDLEAVIESQPAHFFTSLEIPDAGLAAVGGEGETPGGI
ncbi:hypothetical protein D3C77_655660 [compost metagenome]